MYLQKVFALNLMALERSSLMMRANAASDYGLPVL